MLVVYSSSLQYCYVSCIVVSNIAISVVDSSRCSAVGSN